MKGLQNNFFYDLFLFFFTISIYDFFMGSNCGHDFYGFGYDGEITCVFVYGFGYDIFMALDTVFFYGFG